MNKLYSHRYILKNNLFVFIGVCLCLYFSFHAFQGDRGALALVSTNSQIETLSSQSDKLKAERQALEQKVSMMRPGSVDRDLLEERVRATLGYKYDDEYAVLSH